MNRLFSVFGTNPLITALCFPHSIPCHAFDRANESGYLLFSETTLLEARDVLEREKFDRYIPREKRRRFFRALAKKAVLVQITERLAACRDPDDDKFLELAVCGEADVLVSGDDDLLALHPFRGIPIVKARAFLSMELPG